MVRRAVSLAEGDLGTALALGSEGRAIFWDVADRTGLAWADAVLAETHLLRGEVATARNRAVASLALARENARPTGLMMSLRVNAEVGLAGGDLAAARTQLREAVELGPKRGSYSLPVLLETFARVAVAEAALARALRLASASATQREKLGLKMRPIDEARLVPSLQQAKEMLSDAERSAAWAEGQAMTLEKAVAYALEEPAT
jgi:hypothetical protein